MSKIENTIKNNLNNWKSNLDSLAAVSSDILKKSNLDMVRCKYCEHYRKEQPCYSNDNNTYFFCLKLGRYMDENDFCSYGRRQS